FEPALLGPGDSQQVKRIEAVGIGAQHLTVDALGRRQVTPAMGRRTGLERLCLFYRHFLPTILLLGSRRMANADTDAKRTRETGQLCEFGSDRRPSRG